MENVPFLDLRAAHDELAGPIGEALARVARSGWYILGPEVDAFEKAFASFVDAKHCVGVGNGLDALTLSLAAAGVGPGDEVIVPANTYIATWLAVTHVGATIVPVEPDEHSLVLDVAAVSAAITRRTRAVLPVHLYGVPVEMDALHRLTREQGLFLLDDAAQAHGAEVRGARVGGLGDATAWSFYPGKNLGALGDAGAVTTNDDAVAERLRVLRNYGSRVKYENQVVGWNSRLDPMQAAVLVEKLRVLEAWNHRRERIVTLYDQAFASSRWLVRPTWPQTLRSAHHLYVVRTTERERLQHHLRERGIETLIHYPIPPYRQRAYAHLGFGDDAFPIATRIHDEVLSLPLGPHVTEAQAQRVIAAVLAFSAG